MPRLMSKDLPLQRSKDRNTSAHKRSSNIGWDAFRDYKSVVRQETDTVGVATLGDLSVFIHSGICEETLGTAVVVLVTAVSTV